MPLPLEAEPRNGVIRKLMKSRVSISSDRIARPL